MRVEQPPQRPDPTETPRGAGGSVELSVERADRYRCARFIVRGVLDSRTTARLTELLVDACVEPTVDVVVIDLAGVTFLGAAGLRCFTHVAEVGRHHHAHVSLWDPPPFARRVLAAGDLPGSVLIEPPEPR